MANITIPVYDGTDYGNWKKRIMMYLKMKKYYTVTSREKVSMYNGDNWEEKTSKQ